MEQISRRIFENWEIKPSWPERILESLILILLTILSGGGIIGALIDERRSR